MNENFSEIHYDVTKKSKIRKFYENSKFLIFSFIFIAIISIISINFYLISKEKKNILLSDRYMKAKIYLEGGEKNKAIDTLKKIIAENHKTYSTLSFFLVINENLIQDRKEVTKLFNYILENNDFEYELKNLIIYKKALYESDFVSEKELLETIKPLINKDTQWKPLALLVAGDYFFYKKEYLKAKEFYMQILSLKNLHQELYDQARFQLAAISND